MDLRWGRGRAGPLGRSTPLLEVSFQTKRLARLVTTDSHSLEGRVRMRNLLSLGQKFAQKAAGALPGGSARSWAAFLRSSYQNAPLLSRWRFTTQTSSPVP